MMDLTEFYGKLPNIGLIGKTRSGKDTVYGILEQIGLDVERVAFGDTMKHHFFDTFPNVPVYPKPTDKLIQYGQAMRQIDVNVWVDPTMDYVRHNTQQLQNAGLRVPSYVFTDIRQENEYEAVVNSGAFMVFIDTPEEIRVKRMLEAGEVVTREILDAETERKMDLFGFHYILKNTGDMEQLKQNVVEMVMMAHEWHKQQKGVAN